MVPPVPVKLAVDAVIPLLDVRDAKVGRKHTDLVPMCLETLDGRLPHQLVTAQVVRGIHAAD